MTDQVGQQAAEAGDAGHIESSLIDGAAEPEVVEEKKEEKAEVVEEKKSDSEHAKQRKSDKKWQLTEEKAQKLDKLLTALDIPEEESKGKDPIELIQERLKASETEVSTLKEDNLRKDFEREVPASISEKYTEAWTKACKEKLDPESKYHKLDYPEIWKLLREDDPKVQLTKRELEKSESDPFAGSVPVTGKSPVPDLTGNKDVQAIMISQMGYKAEDFK